METTVESLSCPLHYQDSFQSPPDLVRENPSWKSMWFQSQQKNHWHDFLHVTSRKSAENGKKSWEWFSTILKKNCLTMFEHQPCMWQVLRHYGWSKKFIVLIRMMDHVQHHTSILDHFPITRDLEKKNIYIYCVKMAQSQKLWLTPNRLGFDPGLRHMAV